MPRTVTSFSNATIKRVRSLAQKKHRAAEGLFMAEGLRIAAEALDAGHIPRILIAAEGSESHALTARLIAATEAAGGETLLTGRDILHKVTGKDNPQGLVGVYPLMDTSLARLDAAAADRWIVCEALKDPGNLGTILRTADAVAAGGVILLDNSCDPFSVEAVRASMGALFTIPVAHASGGEFLNWLRAGPGALVGASLDTDKDYRSANYPAPTFVFMGNEQSGLPPAYEAACDALVKIPMLGKADSLNVAVSCAVLAYEVLARQTRG